MGGIMGGVVPFRQGGRIQIGQSILFAFLAGGSLSHPASAEVPGIINYQGRVAVNATNFNGTGLFKFAIVDGGDDRTLWSNDGTGSGEPSTADPVTCLLYTSPSPRD